MILVGDKNNSSKKIECNASNSYAPIKFGRSNGTASNVIKILMGDSNNKAKEIYYHPLYDWRGSFDAYMSYYTSIKLDNAIEVIAKYSLSMNRNPNLAHENVDTLIFNQLYIGNERYGCPVVELIETGDVSRINNFIYLSKYSKYIKNIIFNHISPIRYVNLCSNIILNNDETYTTSIECYKSIEHVVLDKYIEYLSLSFTGTKNLKSVFIERPNMQISNSFTSHIDGCIILWNRINENGDIVEINRGYDSLISTVSPVLLVYPCIENASYNSYGLVEINSGEDMAIKASDYMSMYNTKNEIIDIIG